ncbi:GyrI-like domain-containing protein [Acidobacteriota bacterium]
MPSRFKPDMQGEYASRINRVIDHINQHLDENLTLGALARIACFSPYHFHRIFHAFMGETLNQFIQRLRLEKSATLLAMDKSTTVTEIAMACGFSGPAAFGRAFKEAFGMSASEWRAGGYTGHSKDGKTKGNLDQKISKRGKDFRISSMYIDPGTRNLKWRIDMSDKKQAHVEVKDFPETTVAYVRHIGPYMGDSALFGRLFQKLFQWAGARGLLGLSDQKVMTVYYDNPDITEEDKLRVDVCLTVPESTEVDGHIGKTTLAGGKYAVARFELLPDEYKEAWDAVFGGWLPQSGFQPDDRPCFELYWNDPQEHPEGRCIVDICVPVKPL